jgi:hypothetical protein
VIQIQGVVTMSQAAAQDSINHGYTIALRYWRDRFPHGEQPHRRQFLIRVAAVRPPRWAGRELAAGWIRHELHFAELSRGAM